MGWKKIVVALAVAAAVGSFGSSRTMAEDIVPGASEPAHDDAFWKDLTARLEAGAQARRDLDKVGTAEKAKLKEMMEKTTDDYLKGMIKDRIVELDKVAALNPPPISLDIDEATIPDLADALTEALGVQVNSWPQRGQGNGNGNGRYTLHERDKSFWDIFGKLSAQHGLTLEGYDGVRIQQSQPGLRRFVPASNGFVVFPMGLTRSTQVNPQGKEGEEIGKPQLSINLMLAADPRMRIVKYTLPTLTEVKDDAGNNLLQNPNQNDYMQDNQQGACVFQVGQGLAVPDNIGKKIVSLKGSAKFILQIAQEIKDVDPKENLNKDVTLQGRTMKIQKFDVKGNSVEFQINSPNGNNQGDKPLRIAFIDANGKQFWQTVLNGGTGGGVGAHELKEPVKIRMMVPTQTTTLDMTFELKDLPIP